jgi:hypothetical protein
MCLVDASLVATIPPAGIRGAKLAGFDTRGQPEPSLTARARENVLCKVCPGLL